METEPDSSRPYRGRHLDTLDERVWEHNTWDNIPWTTEQQQQAESVISQQRASATVLDELELKEHFAQAANKWDKFYSNHSRWFFKDRKWLSLEFPELFQAENRFIWEVGCGAGNTVFPLAKSRIENNNSNEFMIYACDFSEKAIDLVKNFREYNTDYMNAFQYDLLDENSPSQIAPESLDVILCIFVLSALPPSKLPLIFEKLYRLLKPGGLLLFRDYGRGDLTQLRFKPERLLDSSADLYQRGDGTDVHFFTQEECGKLATKAGYEILQNITDRRVIVNRLRMLKMFRVWQQAKFRKPIK
jgi:tRNAThr (cytosine32-N3)-methyltransferase